MEGVAYHLIVLSISPPWLIKCQIFIAKCYRPCGFNNRIVFLTILKVQDEGTRTWISQKGQSTRSCSAGSDNEDIRRKEQPKQSHRCRSPHSLTLCCMPSTGGIICAQQPPGLWHVISILMCHKKTSVTSSFPFLGAPATEVPYTICCPETFPGQTFHLEPTVWLHHFLCCIKPSFSYYWGR